EVGDKDELRKNETDLSKHSSIQSIINDSDNVADIGFHHLNAVNVEKILQLNPNRATGWDTKPPKFLTI
ncbi:Hypothetical predicted protein, partial [Paramuricea clavata]